MPKRKNNNDDINFIKEIKIHFNKIPSLIKLRYTIIDGTATQLRKKCKFDEEQIRSDTKNLKKDSIQEILNKFKDFNIAIDLSDLPNNEKSFDERRAIAHNNFAFFKIENLNNAKKSYSNSEEIQSLQKAKNLLKKSAQLYKSANLSENKNNVEQCICTIRSSLINLKNNINPMAKSKDTFSFKIAECQPKTTTFSDEAYRKYQHTHLTRSIHKLFEGSSPANKEDLPTSNYPKNLLCLDLRSNSLK